MRTFENPANGHHEHVVPSSSIWVFLFGVLYLLYKGLWNHALIWFVLVVVPAALFGGFVLIAVLPIAMIAYTVKIQDILANRYLQRGWRERRAESSPVQATPEESSRLQRVTPTPAGVVPYPNPRPPPDPEFKLCPHCKEEVKYAAVKCKHCLSTLDPHPS
jgi:hypothetical protein